VMAVKRAPIESTSTVESEVIVAFCQIRDEERLPSQTDIGRAASAVRRRPRGAGSTPSSPGTSVLPASRSARTGELPPRDAVAPGGRDG